MFSAIFFLSRAFLVLGFVFVRHIFSFQKPFLIGSVLGKGASLKTFLLQSCPISKLDNFIRELHVYSHFSNRLCVRRRTPYTPCPPEVTPQVAPYHLNCPRRWKISCNWVGSAGLHPTLASLTQVSHILGNTVIFISFTEIYRGIRGGLKRGVRQVARWS